MPQLRKTAEIIMALYVAGFGVFVESHAAGGTNALAWAGFSLNDAWVFGWACWFASCIHAVGLWVNGRARWSPMIRVVGLLFGCGLFICLAWAGSALGNTAAYTYLWIGGGFLAALKTALRDVNLAWRGLYGRIYH